MHLTRTTGGVDHASWVVLKTTLRMRVPAPHRINMSSTTPRPAVAAADAVQPLNAWLRPILIAAVLARVTTAVSFPILFEVYRQLTPGNVTVQLTPRGTLQGLVAVVPWIIALTWAALFALAYRAWPSLRRHLEGTGGIMAIGAVYGCIEWLINHFVVFRSSLHLFSVSFVSWLDAVLVFGPAIVWSIHRFRPQPEMRPQQTAVTETSEAARKVPIAANTTSRDKGYIQIFASILLIVPSVLCMHWIATDPQASNLMILAALIFIGAVAVALVGTSLLLGGIWTVLNWPGRWVARLAPLLLGAVAALVIFGR